ncbi:MAG: Adenylate cyclase 2 [bacterium ADurb.Bin374]|nr:MAG: Adenylate cyclase 2 [bacterium ADurb.Bin374]
MNAFSRRLLFFVGAALLLLPAWLIHTTLSESAAFEQARIRQTTSELLDTALHLVRHQDLGRLLLVDRLEEAAQNFADEIAGSPEANVASGLQEVTRRLERSASRPIFAMSLLVHPRRVDVQGDHTPEERDFFSRFLEMNIQMCFREPAASDAILLSERIPRFLGSVQTISYFNEEKRGTAAPVVFRHRDALLFWMPLIDKRKAAELLRSPTPDTLFAPNVSTVREHIRQRMTLGGILFIMPPTATGKLSIESTIRRYANLGIRLAFVSEDSRSITAHASWRKPPLSACLDGASSPQNWVVSRGTAFVGRRHTVLAAMKLPAGTPGRGNTTILIRTFCWATSAMAVLTWFSTLFRGGGLALSLGRQLSAGFLLAALFPLTTMFLVIEPYADERHEVRVQEIRTDLRNTINLLELQALAHRPRIWHLLSRLFGNRTFLEAARRDAAGDDPAARAELERRFKNIFLYLYNEPIDLSLRKVILAGMGSYVRHQSRPRDPVGGPSMLAELMNHNANVTLTARGTGMVPGGSRTVSDDPERGSALATKREMVWDVGREIFLSVLGPEAFFDWINGKNEPLLLEIGIGMVMLYEMFLPSQEAPEFLLSILLKAEYHENNAMSRTLSGKWRDGPLFVFQRDKIGKPCHPGTGERHPFLRRVARQVDASSRSLSLRLSDGNTRWLVEGAPGVYSRQFVFVALADEAPLLAETAAIKRRLNATLLVAALITLLLAASATQDIVSPIRSLIVGIQAVSAENYTHRVPSDRSDELGELADTFNKMARGLEERNILRKMVSSSALTAATSGDDEKKAREGARREFIVCFVSFTGIETAMASMSPEAALELLNRHVIVASRILHAAGADIDKLLGQKILAVFPPELDAVAVKTARRLQAAHQEGALSFRPAVGMTIGSVVTGILGSGDRRDHTIIGDTVNLAARAAALAERFAPVAVVLDEALRLRVRDIGSYESLGETCVKGKSHPVRLVRLLDPKRRKSSAASGRS